MKGAIFWVPVGAGIYALAGGLLALLGWFLDIQRLADWDGDGISMQPNSGVAAMLTGAGLVLVQAGRRKVAAVLGALVAGGCALTLLQHLTGLNFGIDQLLLFNRSWGSLLTVTPGRMGVPGAVSWTLAGLALCSFRREEISRAVPVIGLIMVSIAGLSIIGYLFGADLLYSLPRLTAIALQTGTMLFAVGMGLIAIAPDRQPMRILLGETSGSALARRALPFVILLPLGLGFLCVRGQRSELYDASMGFAILVVVLILAQCAILWSGASAVIRREESLRRSEERFSLFMEHLPGLAWIKDETGRYLFANQAAENVFGAPRERLYGRTDDEIFPRETAAQFRKNDQDALTNGRGVQVIETLKHDDGLLHYSIVSKFPIGGSRGRSRLIGGMAIDITDRMRAEEMLKKLYRTSERLNSTLGIDDLLDVLVEEATNLVGTESGAAGLNRPEGMVCTKYFRDGVFERLEYCWPPLHGLPGWLIVHKVPYLTNDAKSDSQIVHSLCEQFGVWSALSTPIISAHGEVLGFFELHNKRDRSGFTAADQELLVSLSQVAAIAVQNALAYQTVQQAEESLKQADRRKDEFLAMLAHELRNPLAPIRSGLEIVKHVRDQDDMIASAHQAMERQVHHLVRLVDDLLDLSRISRDKLELRKEVVELAPIVRQAVEMCQPQAKSQNQKIQVTLPDRPIHLIADPVRLAQVFSNLLNNACKFSPADSEITISARREGSDVVVAVDDEGLGIPADQIGQVFDMFKQVHQSFARSRGGLGIGLTLVKRIVELHGGNVIAQSEGEGCGSRFEVTLPAFAGDLAEGPAATTTRPSNGGTRRVLVVDDNRDAANTLGTLLKLTGHTVELAYDGEEACQAAERYRPEVILLDLGLPKMNGYDACRAIRQTPWGAGMLIVALTGWGKENDRHKSAEAGFDSHLVKPVDHKVLARLLDASGDNP